MQKLAVPTSSNFYYATIRYTCEQNIGKGVENKKQAHFFNQPMSMNIMNLAKRELINIPPEYTTFGSKCSSVCMCAGMWSVKSQFINYIQLI